MNHNRNAESLYEVELYLSRSPLSSTHVDSVVRRWVGLQHDGEIDKPIGIPPGRDGIVV